MPDEKNEHNVFISWSGNRSRHVAEALRDWLPMVLQAAKPFMSKRDIDKGSRWHLELAKALENTKVGIVCLTPENLSASWLLFEAGAVSKTLDRGTRVFTYLLAGLKAEEVRPPLGDFQATRAEKEETRQMLQDANKSLGSSLSENTLNDLFDLTWPRLVDALTKLPEPEMKVPPKREVEDMVAEILDATRAAAKDSQALVERVEHIDAVLDRAPFGDYGMTLWESGGTTFYTKTVPGAPLWAGRLSEMAGTPKETQKKGDDAQKDKKDGGKGQK